MDDESGESMEPHRLIFLLVPCVFLVFIGLHYMHAVCSSGLSYTQHVAVVALSLSLCLCVCVCVCVCGQTTELCKSGGTIRDAVSEEGGKLLCAQ